MNYLLHKSPDASHINRIVIIFPGMDEITDSAEPQTTNDINKYNLFAKLTAELCGSNTAVVVSEYLGPNKWGTPISLSTMADDLALTLQSALNELKQQSLSVNVSKVDLMTHSYGQMALFLAAANGVLGRVIGNDSTIAIDLHLFEPCGIAAIKDATENTPTYRDQEVAAAVRNLARDAALATDPSLAALDEITRLRSFEPRIININFVFGNFRPNPAIHSSYLEMQRTTGGTPRLLDGVGHGLLLADVARVIKDQSTAPAYVVHGFENVMNAAACCLSGIKAVDPSEAAVRKRAEVEQRMKVLINQHLTFAPKEQQEPQKLKLKM